MERKLNLGSGFQGLFFSVQELLNYAYKLLDKSVSKGVLHKNTAARKKSRLTKHVNKTLAQ